jgi:hypothetical protein
MYFNLSLSACKGGETIEVKYPGNTTIESVDRGQDLPYLNDLICTTTLKWDPKRLVRNYAINISLRY